MPRKTGRLAIYIRIKYLGQASRLAAMRGYARALNPLVQQLRLRRNVGRQFEVEVGQL